MRANYDKDQLDQLLGFDIYTSNSPAHEYSDNGPGYMDTWLSLMEGNEKSWLKAKDSALQIKGKKKIIISDPMLSAAYFMISDDNWSFFSYLIAYYDVYLWTPYKNFSACKPLENVVEFFNTRTQINAATKEDVEAALIQQGLAIKNIAILDHASLAKINPKLNNMNGRQPFINLSSNTLDLTKVSIQDEQEMAILRSGIDFNHIDTVSIESCRLSDVKKVLHYFPNIKEIQFCNNLNFNDYPSVLSLLDGINITMKNVTSDKLPILSKNINTLTIVESNFKVLFIQQDTKEIIVTKSPIQEIFFNRSHAVESLSLIECKSLKAVYFEAFTKLKKLHLRTSRFPLDLINDPQSNKMLEDLIICDYTPPGANLFEFTFHENESIKHLELVRLNGLIKIEAKSFHQLKTLIVGNCAPLLNKSIEKIIKEATSLETLEIGPEALLTLSEPIPTLKKLKIRFNAIGIEKLNFNLFPNIETLEFSGNSEKEIDFSSLKNLKHLTLSNCDFKNINISRNEKLQDLNIKSCTTLENILWPKSEATINKDIINCPGITRKKNEDASPFSFGITKDNINQINSTCLNNKLTLVLNNLDGDEISAIHNMQLIKAPLTDILHLETEGGGDFTQVNFATSAKIFPNVESLYLSNAFLPVNCVIHYAKLQIFTLSRATVEHLDLSHCTDLKKIDISLCQRLKSIKFPKNAKIENLNISTCPSLAISLLDQKDLNQININVIKQIDIENCPSLSVINIDEFKVAHIDLKKCNRLRRMKMIGNTLHLDNAQDALNLPCAIIGSTNPVNGVANLSPHCQLISSQENKKINDAARLQQLNDKSPVAIFNFSETMNVDGDTNPDKSLRQANGLFKVSFVAKQELSRHLYRINDFDEIKYKSGKLTYECKADPAHLKSVKINQPGFNTETLTKLHQAVMKDDQYALGMFEGILVAPNIIYPLPDLGCCNIEDIEIYTNPPNAVNLSYHRKRQQFYISVNKKAVHKDQPVNILYRLKRNPICDNAFKSTGPLNVIVKDPLKLLPKTVYKTLQNKIAALPNNHPLAKILKQNIALGDKIRLLADYCEHFENLALDENTLDKKLNDNIDLEFQIIAEHKGACRHRARAFMLLARMLGVPANIVANEMHAFAEIPFEQDGVIMRTYADLGGADVNDMTPIENRKNVFDNIPTAKTLAEVTSKNTDTLSNEKNKTEAEKIKTEVDLWEEVYYDLFKQMIAKDDLSSLTALFTANELNLSPLLELRDQASLYRINELIATYVRKNIDSSLQQYIYIDNPKDFALYLKPYQIKKGGRRQIAGPLKAILDKGGTIVVNWSSFSATEIASYKSIIDANPTILGEPVSDKVKVIGLVTTNTQLCAATLSRCKRYTLNSVNDLNEETNTTTTSKTESPAEEIDLFHQPNWREKLLGKVNMDGTTLSLIDGAIFKALNQEKKLIIYNPPRDDKDYELLLYRINVEKRFLYNGKFIRIPDNFSIEIKQKTHPNHLKNVVVESSANDIKHNKIYLGMHNLHECMERLSIDNDTHTAKTLPGLLATFDSDNDVFYITQSITEHAWQALLADISKYYPQKHFRFVLREGVSIENVLTNPTQPVVDTSKAVSIMQSTYLSNDPDYLTSQLSQINPQALVVDISRETSFRDLIAELSVKNGFHYDEKGVLKLLKKPDSKTLPSVSAQVPIVILNGEMTPLLYQQLLPLLNGEKELMVNGKKIEITGKLVAVMPQQCKDYIQEAREIQFNVNDYLNQLAQPDLKYGESIIQFLNFTKALPHRGQGMPAQPRMTQKRFQHMVDKLKSGKCHPHNPIKGLFHFDYLKDSKDYAYLNVMAKYLFDHSINNATKIEEKIVRVIHQYNIQTEQDIEKHLWHILNCYDGRWLKRLLGNDYHPSLTNKNNYPFVTEEIIEKIKCDVKTVLTLPLQEKIRNPDKKLNQVVELLKDPNIPMLFLKGQPGVGKSHAIRHSEKELNIKCYEGDDAIMRWLNATSGPAVLLLDEANMARPGTWNFLNGINREQKKIYYQGHFYELKPYHKIIATGNPENYPDRFYHEIFQQTAETILFKQFSDAELKDKILTPLLAPFLSANDLHKTMANMLFAFHLIEKYNPYFSYSTRDLENLSIRFLYLVRTYPNKNKNDMLEQAIEYEFAGMVYEKEKRAQFIDEIKQTFEIKRTKQGKEEQEQEQEIYKLTDKHVITREKAYVAKAIQEDLAIRKMMLEGEQKLAHQFYKTCILIEGDAGLGKSKMYKSILDSLGFSDTATSTGNQKYYTVSAGNNETYETLIKAFDEGAIVILDELNLDKGLERLLNDLLTGVYQGRKALHPGFMVLASQNPGSFAGREPLSPALRNRTHFLYMDKYSKSERKALASHHGIKNPDAFVKAVKRAQQGLPKHSRMRTFFKALNHAKKIANDPEVVKAIKSTRR